MRLKQCRGRLAAARELSVSGNSGEVELYGVPTRADRVEDGASGFGGRLCRAA
jgi:hypothetical protein